MGDKIQFKVYYFGYSGKIIASFMCGIAGIYRFHDVKISHDRLKKMTDLLFHRGPDGSGHWIKDNIGLGHRRLSIIDLSDGASQPMTCPYERFVISYNGEIYNYQELREKLSQKGYTFKSHSDTEVILNLFHEYRHDSFNHLRGMFAFALWDRSEKVLYLVRDRFGIKPLYYLVNKDEVIFASEIKAVAGICTNLSVNRNAFFGFLRTATLNNNQTIFNEIKKLAPATYLYIKGPEIKEKQYWKLEDTFINDDQKQGRSYEKEFENHFAKSIKYHMVSDVPVGGFLSGGLDSSAIVAYMRKEHPQNSLFTSSVIFPGHSEIYNEEPFSDLVARILNTNHNKYNFDHTFLVELERICWYADEPFGIMASYAIYFLARETAKNVKVVLTGDGADEILAGYQKYLPSSTRYNNTYVSLYSGLVNMLGFINRQHIISFKGYKSLIIKILYKLSPSVSRFRTTYSGPLVFEALNREYIVDAWESWLKDSGMNLFENVKSESELRQKLFVMMKTRLVDEMLTKTDRMTMAHSLEARVPFLDHTLVEFTNKMPDHWKLHPNEKDGGFTNKYILRKISETLLPHEIVYRTKHSFDIPYFSWFRENNITGIEEQIFQGSLMEQNLINKDSVSTLFAKYKSGDIRSAQFILNLYIFEIWLNNYRVNFPGLKISF